MELSLDTASDLASVAVSQQGQPYAELTWRCRTNHSVEVLPAIDYLLTSSGAIREDLRAIFVCRGPGSYGGLRAGLSLAMSLASALRIDILGAGRLEVEAYQQSVHPGPICAIHRAGRGELAWAAYQAKGVDVEELVPLQLAGPDDLLERAPRGALFCGEIDDELAVRLTTADPTVRIARGSAPIRRAGFLAELAWHRYSAGERAAGGFVEPLYLREPNITKPKPRL